MRRSIVMRRFWPSPPYDRLPFWHPQRSEPPSYRQMHKVVSDLLRQRALLISLAIGGLYERCGEAGKQQLQTRWAQVAS